ncbi:hypothetical protein [Escherichia coli]|uniref:hypothetical protein n=1 Tax=Escherichia coli TaxID=562 RepID=UPI0024825865|nr:hypothetical protein [Escherichia coli]MDI1422449.1 hypothetical protein [Escherichia coli]HCO5927064.1 hypothetical protein [Escherichia coli]
MGNIKKIVIFLSTALISLLIYILLFIFQLGSSITAEWWLHDVKVKKEQILGKYNSNRIVIISGSNGLFGFDSKLLSKLTGYNTVNLAMHASLDLSYYRMLIQKNIRKDDIVIMPLEYAYYSRENEYSDWFVSNMQSWGTDYIKWLPLDKKIEFFSKVTWKNVLTGIITPDRDVIDKEKTVLSDPGNDKGYYYGYNYKTLTPRGDINRAPYHSTEITDMIANPDKYEEILSYGKSNPAISIYTLSELSKIRKIVTEKGAKLFITWPTTMRTKYFNQYDTTAITFTNSIQSQLLNNGFSVICNTFYANIDPDLFLDTNYHLDAIGAKVRSESFFKCLKNDKVI